MCTHLLREQRLALASFYFLAWLRPVLADVAAAARATGIDLVEGETLSAEVVLEPVAD